MPGVVGVLSVMVTGPVAGRTGCGEGQPAGLTGQSDGTGPIVVVDDEIVPSSGLEYDDGWIVMTAFVAGCEVPWQTRLKLTDRVTVSPGPFRRGPSGAVFRAG